MVKHQNKTHPRPTWTSKGVTRADIRAAGRVAPGQYSYHAGRKLLAITWSIRRALLVIQKHVNVLDAVLEHTSAPFDLVEEKLLLEAARDLHRDRTIGRFDALVEEEFRDDARL
jgi:hypothetical protein